MSLFDWQSAESVERIQDTNFVADFVDDFFNQYNAYQGLVLSPQNYSSGLRLLKSLDSTVRIPGALTNGTSFGIGDSKSNFPPIDVINCGQGMISDCRNRSAISGYQNVLLDYMPRMYVELTSLPDFITNNLAPLGITHHYTDTFLYNYYEARHSGRLMYDTTELLPNRDELYVLTKYVIYTNKTTGETQSALATYDWNTVSTSTAPLIWYDTYIPFNLYSNNTSLGSPIGDLFYYPYMRNFRAQKIDRIDTRDYSYLIGGVPGVHDNIRRVTSTGDGDISPNPWLSSASGTADRNTWVLSTRPKAPTYTYIAADKKTWKKILTGSGMMWSTVLEDVTAPDDDDLVKPTKPGQPQNPYNDDDDGDGDNISDEIPLPYVEFNLNNNAYNRYWIKSADLISLQNWVFSETFLTDIRRLWNDPAEYLINLSLYPFNGYMHDVNNVATSKISIGNLTSDITAYQMSDGYSAKFNGGSFKLAEYYGSYLDYAPYTSAEIYIPYIGYKPLNINDIMGKTIDLIYVVDWDTNMLTATLLVDDRPLTMYSGAFGVKLAISGTNANQVAETIARGASGIISNAGMSVANIATGNIPGAIGYGMKALGGAMDTALDVQISPRQFGAPTPLTGLYNTQVPHVIIHRPIAAEPIDFKAQNGYSASYSAPVSSFEGYLQCSSVKLSGGSTMSETEQNEIISLLKGGIYI